jgi:hypothetical protein
VREVASRRSRGAFRLPERSLNLWGGRKLEDEFVALAERSGARRITKFAPDKPIPPRVYVYDFR